MNVFANFLLDEGWLELDVVKAKIDVWARSEAIANKDVIVDQEGVDQENSVCVDEDVAVLSGETVGSWLTQKDEVIVRHQQYVSAHN